MNIYSAMCAAMKDIGAITKGRTNTQQGFKFRGIDDVYNELHDILAKHKIFTVPEVLDSRTEERTTRNGGALIYRILTMRYTFFCEDGSSVSCVVTGEGMDSGDKAANKAMSIAHKYALFQTFLIPTEDEKDPDAQSHDVAPKAKPAPTLVAKEEAHKAAPSGDVEPQKHDDLDQKQQQAKIAEMLLEMCGTNDAAQDKLMELTTWKNAKGEVVEGKTNPFHLNVKPNSKGMTQTSVTYTKVREMYHDWEKENG